MSDNLKYNSRPFELKHEGYLVKFGGVPVGRIGLGNHEDMAYSANTLDLNVGYPYRTGEFLGWYTTIDMAVGAIAAATRTDLDQIDRDLTKGAATDAQS